METECVQLVAEYAVKLSHFSHQWAIHVPLGTLQTERLVPVDAFVCRIVQRLRVLRRPAVALESEQADATARSAADGARAASAGEQVRPRTVARMAAVGEQQVSAKRT